MTTEDLVTLAERYALHVDRSEQTISNWITGTHARLFTRLRAGLGCNAKTLTKAFQWFSDNWPDDLAWPSDIPRPSKSKKEAA
ncbi:hypothetical protein JYP51_09600 [Ponticoccus gilvus]|nr:hypothetical protein [Enemella evansiae]